jgi:PAS domain-containing protein
MLDAVIVTDSEGRYAMVNGAAGRLLGMDPDVERHLRILVVDDEPALVTMLARLLSSEGMSCRWPPQARRRWRSWPASRSTS